MYFYGRKRFCYNCDEHGMRGCNLVSVFLWSSGSHFGGFSRHSLVFE